VLLEKTRLYADAPLIKKASSLAKFRSAVLCSHSHRSMSCCPYLQARGHRLFIFENKNLFLLHLGRHRLARKKSIIHEVQGQHPPLVKRSCLLFPKGLFVFPMLVPSFFSCLANGLTGEEQRQISFENSVGDRRAGRRVQLRSR
jgi:hypothetical protein